MSDTFFILLLIFRIFTSEAYLNEHLAVIHPKYISDSIASGTKTTLMSYKLPPEEVYQGADCIQGSKYLPSLLFLHLPPNYQLTTLRLGKFFFLIFLNKVTNLRLSKTVWWCKRVEKKCQAKITPYTVIFLLEFLGKPLEVLNRILCSLLCSTEPILIKICLLSSTLLSFESFTFHPPLQNLWAKFNQTWHIEKGRL